MALYNQGYPATYTPYYTQQTSQPAQGLIWVQGEAGAKSYLVAPNNTVQLWDSESQTIYLKSADATGLPSMRILDYTIRDSNKTPSNSLSSFSNDNLSTYATKAEIDGLNSEIQALKAKLDKLTRKMKEDDDE